ncbi:hypothetical protein F5Y10DRAFT_244621 [Nemania abortiva]|nr:hypothetical protein F5Y10DRAFT_244621 [Nemania abortiva]
MAPSAVLNLTCWVATIGSIGAGCLVSLASLITTYWNLNSVDDLFRIWIIVIHVAAVYIPQLLAPKMDTETHF